MRYGGARGGNRGLSRSEGAKNTVSRRGSVVVLKRLVHGV